MKGPVDLPTEFPSHRRVPHWETGTALGILDNERATKISGAMFTMLRGGGAALARALCQYALDRNVDAFEEIRPPTLVTTATLTATGQLPKFADDAYCIERDDLWCIPTAEVPLTSIYAGEIVDAELSAVAPHGLHAVLSPRSRLGRSRHARHVARSRVRQGRDSRRVDSRASARSAGGDDRSCRGTDRRARSALSHHRDLHRRHGSEPPPQLRHRGVRAGQRRLARGVVDLVVQRLPVAACRHPISGRRPERYADRSHAQRVGPRSSACLGSDRRELSRYRRQRSSCPTCCIHTCAGVERITGR